MIIREVIAEVQNGELKVMMNSAWYLKLYAFCLSWVDFGNEWLQDRYPNNVQFFPLFFVPKTKF